MNLLIIMNHENTSCLPHSAQESAFFLPYPHPTIVDMQYVSHVERAVASAMLGAQAVPVTQLKLR